MQHIDELIEFEPENTGLDFKATPYKKENLFEFLKDVMAIANASLDREGLIIVGVKKHADNSFTVNPLPADSFVDAATYQNLVIENIEPDLHIEYLPHLYKSNQLVGVFKIDKATDKPYIMKKVFGSGNAIRRKGESFIRKGTTTFPLMRQDIDRIYEQRRIADAYTHQVSFYFSGISKVKILEVFPASTDALPSQKKAIKIQSIIDKKEKEKAEQDKLKAEIENQAKLNQRTLTPGLANLGALSLTKFPVSNLSIFGTTYEERDIKTLKDDLEQIHQTYYEDDCYELYENRAERINLTILNEGTQYLEDAFIRIEVPIMEGLFVANELYAEPDRSSSPFLISIPKLPDWKSLNYPRYKKDNGLYTYSEKLGDLRHLQPKEVFEVPIRIALTPALAGKEIEVNLILFGKNLPQPIKDILIIRIAAIGGVDEA